MAPVKILVVGAGGRGTGYSTYAGEFPDQAQIVGVAEPRDHYRQNMVNTYKIPAENAFTDWRQAAAKPKFADAVIIATQDNMHADPAVAFAKLGYHMLLEKPMAPSETECRRIYKAVKDAKIIFAVCHVLRYTGYTTRLKAMLDEGVVGDIVSIQHLEPVGYWHQAHSFVRGNWRNEGKSSPMLLAKSCHDLDWIRYIMGVSCKKVSSFGTLRHFRKEFKPAGAAERCLDCSFETKCPYSAMKLYLGMLRENKKHWPLDVITTDLTEQGVAKALREGPYGRCVYTCDNDVVDHQVVAMEFEGGKSGVFTMTAFTEGSHRQTRIFGTKGQIVGNGKTIELFDFLTDKTTVVDTTVSADGSLLSGHGGGDFGLMKAFVSAVATNDPKKVLSGAEETLESHLMVFASEKARKENKVVSI